MSCRPPKNDFGISSSNYEVSLDDIIEFLLDPDAPDDVEFENYFGKELFPQTQKRDVSPQPSVPTRSPTEKSQNTQPPSTSNVSQPQQLPSVVNSNTNKQQCHDRTMGQSSKRPFDPDPTSPGETTKKKGRKAEADYRGRLRAELAKLKNIVDAGSAPICGVYKKAVDCIQTLRYEICHLKQENVALKLKLMENSYKNSDADTDSVVLASLLHTPECLFDANSPSLGSSICADVPDDAFSIDSLLEANSPGSLTSDDSWHPGNPSPMFDRTRFFTSLFMLSFFVFDPFDLLFAWHSGATSSSRGAMHNGRLLMAVDPTLPQPASNWPSMSFVICLLLRTFAVTFIFLKLFVFGEPSLQPDSKIAAKYWAFKRKADVTLEKGDYIEGSKILGRCLEILGRPLPTSRLDMICSLLWHIFRQIVHRVVDTRWLTAKAIQWFSLKNTHEKDIEYRQESAKQAALVYHQLHHIYLAGHVFVSKRLATVVALSAVNMADMADTSLSEEIRVDIYIDCAIQLRSKLPTVSKFLARYFLSRARKLCRGQSLTLPYSCWWLFTPVGHRFFVSGEWNCKREANIWSSSKINDKKPLAIVTQAFCEFLLEQAMSALLSSDTNPCSANTWNIDRPDDNSGIKRAFDLLHTMTECVNNSRKSGINRNLKVFGDFTTWPSDEPDLVGCWWAALGKVAAYWLLGDVQAAQQQYKIIENIPEEIDNDSDPIGQALLMAFRARSCLLGKGGKNPDDAHQILDYCDKGGAILKESLAFSSLYPQSHLLKLMHLLCCDWLLSTRADLWHNEKLDGEKHSLEASRLNGFNKDLRSLQDIAFYISDAMPKVYKYQAELGVMADSNPLKTQRLLQKSLVQQRSANEGDSGNAVPRSSVSAEKDRTSALVLASSHLPASLYPNDVKRKDMIFEAMESLQKFGDKDRLARCRKLVTISDF